MISGITAKTELNLLKMSEFYGNLKLVKSDIFLFAFVELINYEEPGTSKICDVALGRHLKEFTSL